MAAEGATSATGRALRVALILSLIVTAQAIGSSPASAVSCGAGKHIFIRNGSTNQRWGVKGRISVPNRQLDPTCNSAVFTSVHFSNCSAFCSTFVEVGLKQSSSGLVIWTEQETNGVVTHNDNITTGAYNSYITFRLKVAQNGDVFFEYNFGSGWVTTWSSPYSTNWAPGYPMGETEKKGDATQMTSSHRSMQFLASDWSETNWSSEVCVNDEAPGWSWSPVGSNGWDVVNVGGGTCVPA
ncbi:MAG: hypothetical protein ACXWEG_04465 [Actinomycetota bacterium]